MPPKKPKTTITIALEIEGDPDDARDVVDTLLDERLIQDSVNEHDEGLKVVDARRVDEDCDDDEDDDDDDLTDDEDDEDE